MTLKQTKPVTGRSLRLAIGSDNTTEVKQNTISQQRDYNCLNLKKCDERTNGRTDNLMY